jgi:hydrogenase expression/formation protein HypE
MANVLDLSCPISLRADDIIQMAHGAGGRLTQELIERLFRPAFCNPALDTRHDGAILPVGGMRLAFTTDSYVVHPLIFPGGDIGTLAICGTANDLAVCGARPKWIGAGFILEEGLSQDTLRTVVSSMRAAAEAAGVQLVTGDTKVVERGHCDGMFINTSGVGVVEVRNLVAPSAVQAGDAVLISGDIGRHGMAVMSVRENLGFEGEIVSDVAPLWPVVEALLGAGIDVHCLRDLTRGGLAAALNEIAAASGMGIELEENLVPVDAQVAAACEVLGIDPMYVANEGRLVAMVPEAQAGVALSTLRKVCGPNATLIGQVLKDHPHAVTVTNEFGTRRVLDLLSGELLPRIC